MKLPLLYEDIIKLLPHRYPFLLVDKVIDINPGISIIAQKNVTNNEYFFQGHFPQKPIMPGVLIIEAMAQAAGIMAVLSMQEDSEDSINSKLIYFMSIDKVKFRKPVVPGDILRLEAEKLRGSSRVWKLTGKAFVENSLVAEAEFAAIIE